MVIINDVINDIMVIDDVNDIMVIKDVMVVISDVMVVINDVIVEDMVIMVIIDEVGVGVEVLNMVLIIIMDNVKLVFIMAFIFIMVLAYDDQSVNVINQDGKVVVEEVGNFNFLK